MGRAAAAGDAEGFGGAVSDKPFHVLPFGPPFYYPELAGPAGFSCTLTEPEDRTWGRDLRPVVARLNEFHFEVEQLMADRERLRKALIQASGWMERAQAGMETTTLDEAQRRILAALHGSGTP